MQKSSDSWVGKKHSISGNMSTPTRGKGNQLPNDVDWHPNLRVITGRLNDYDNAVSSVLLEVTEK